MLLTSSLLRIGFNERSKDIIKQGFSGQTLALARLNKIPHPSSDKTI
jgi:hypothetical protein